MKIEHTLQKLWPSQGFVDNWRCPEQGHVITWGGNGDTLTRDLLKHSTQDLWTAVYIVPQHSTSNLLSTLQNQVYEEGDVQSPEQFEQVCLMCVWSLPDCAWNLVAVISNIPTNLDDDILDSVCLVGTGQQTTAEVVNGLGWYINDTHHNWQPDQPSVIPNDVVFAAMDLIASLPIPLINTATRWNTWSVDPEFAFAFTGYFLTMINRYPDVNIAPVSKPREHLFTRWLRALFKKDHS